MYSLLKNKTKHLYFAFAIYLIATKNADWISTTLMIILCLILNSIYSYDKNLIKAINRSRELNLKIESEMSFVKRYIRMIDIVVVLISTAFITSVIMEEAVISSIIVILSGVIRFLIWDSIDQILVSHITDLTFTNDETLKDIL